MFIEEITQYRTGDGKTHSTEKQAELHALDCLCEIVSKAIGSESNYTALKYKDKTQIIYNLVGTKERYYALLHALEKFDF